MQLPLVMLFVVVGGVCYVILLNSLNCIEESSYYRVCISLSFALIAASNVLTTTKATTLLRRTAPKPKKITHSTIYSSKAVHKSRLPQQDFRGHVKLVGLGNT